MDLLPLFEWIDTSMLADISKAYGGVFAVVQMFHLLSLALLGGAVLVGDLRLLGVMMRDIPSEIVVRNPLKLFNVALIVVLASGIFMMSAVAIKLYYNEMFWVKMTSLGLGILFVYAVRRPLLLSYDHNTISALVLKSMAVTSMVLWFTVAASGRWIGFS